MEIFKDTFLGKFNEILHESPLKPFFRGVMFRLGLTFKSTLFEIL